jgi:hypothetical protein
MQLNFSVPASVIAGVLGLALSGPLMAAQDEDFNFDTTEDLFQVCSTPVSSAEAVPASFACRAFIEATMQYHDEVTDRKNLKRLVCYPQTATIGDGRSAFVAWAKANAADKTLMGETPVVGVVRALAAKYPCK